MTLASGHQNRLMSCRAEAFGSLVVENKLKEMDEEKHGGGGSTERREEDKNVGQVASYLGN